MCYYVAKAVLYLPIALHEKSVVKSQQSSNESASKLDYLNTIKTQLKKTADLLKNYHTRTKQSQKILLDSTQDFFIESPFNSTNYGSKLGFLDACYVKILLYFFEECEILNDKVTLEWYEKQKKSLENLTESKRHAVKKLEPFMKWLEESDDSDSEED